MTARSAQRLHDLLDPVVSAAGYELVELSVSAAGRRSLVRVTVDGDAGIDLDAVADVSRLISTTLDDNDDAFAGPFVLEVSSPGIDRPLTEPRLWRRALNRLVSVAVNGASEPTVGRVTQLDDDGITLDVDGQARRLSWAEVGTGRVQVEFSRPGEKAKGGDHSDDADFEDGDFEDGDFDTEDEED